MFTDASTSFGGGGLLKDVGGNELRRGQMIWSQEEHRLMEEMNVSINVLEFFSATYFVLLWGEELRGEVVKVWCDNTSAVAWMSKMRGKSSSFASMGVVRVLSLFCQLEDITLCPCHIAGVQNIEADFLSRCRVDAQVSKPASFADVD
jgi:hypothetical protein